jgi:hypothetical protein
MIVMAGADAVHLIKDLFGSNNRGRS